jgi:hypothetical protein
VGRPIHYPQERLWYCPVKIEGYTRGVDTVFGMGPVDALMNAMTLVKRFFDEVTPTPGAKPNSGKKEQTSRKAQVKKGTGRPKRATAKRKSSGADARR